MQQFLNIFTVIMYGQVGIFGLARHSRVPDISPGFSRTVHGTKAKHEM